MSVTRRTGGRSVETLIRLELTISINERTALALTRTSYLSSVNKATSLILTQYFLIVDPDDIFPVEELLSRNDPF